MASIDEKVVRLTMDDSQFDKASDKTIKKLDDLKKSLEFSGAVSSFDELDKAASKVDISPLEKGAESLAKRFTALEAIALGALIRIGNQAVVAGENLLKSLTIDNVSAGWSKYADKTAAVQTIMSATAKQFEDTGEQMAFVESKLERLNWFTDETSYKFLDMVNNIGKFTNNNVELGKAVTAMEGISTWAASAGANTNEAGRAMYNLSQAIAVGSVKLIDWKSIENANMATAEFKQIAIETAEELGTLKRVGESTWETLSGKGVSVANFNENLSEAWFSSEVLLKTLDRYGGFADRLADVVDETGVLTTTLLGYIDEYIDGTLDISEAVSETGLSAEELNALLQELGDDQYELGRRAFKAAQETKTFAEAIDYVKEAVSSSWMQSFEYIFGNYTEAKKLWSDLSEALYEVFVESGNVRNELLKLWKDSGGRDRFIESVKTALKNLMKVVDAISEGFKRIFPDATLETLLVATRRFEVLIETLTPSEKLLSNISDAVEFLVNVISKVIGLAAAVVSGLDPILDLLIDIFGVVMNLAGFASGEGNNVLNQMFDQDSLQKIHDTIYSISEIIATIARILITIGAGAFGGIIQFASNIWQTFQEGEGGIRGFFQAIVVNVQSAINAFTSGESTISKIVGAIVDKVKELINSFKEAASGGDKNGIGGFLGGIVLAIENSGVFDTLRSLINMINAALISIADGVAGILTGGTELRDVIAFIQDQLAFLWDWLSSSISQMTFQDLAVVALILSMKSLTDTAKKAVTGLNGVLTGIKTTITSLANTISSFANGNWLNDLGKNLSSIASNTKYAQIALAIYVAVEGIIKLSEVPIDDLAYAVSALSVILGLVTLALKAMDKIAASLASRGGGTNNTKNLARVASSIQALGIAVGAISASVWAISQVIGDEGDYTKLIASVTSVGLILASVVGSMAIVDKLNIDTSKFAKIGPALITFAVTVDLLALAVVALAQFDPTNILAAAGSVSLIVVALGAMGKLIEKTDFASILAAGATMLTMASAMVVMSVAIAALGAAFSAFPDGIAAAMINLIGLIVTLTLAMGLLGMASKGANPVALLAMGAAMITFSASITILAAALHLLASVEWETMGKGAALLGAALLGFLAVAAIATGFSVGLAALTAVLVGLAAVFISIGLAANMLAEAAIKIGIFVMALVVLSEEFGDELPAKISTAFDTLELIIKEFLEMLRNLAPDFALTFAALIAAGIEAIILVTHAKKYAMVEAVLSIALAIIELIARLGPPIIDATTRMIEGLSEGLPQLLEALGVIIEQLFEGIGVILNHAIIGLGKGILAIFGITFNDVENAAKKQNEVFKGETRDTMKELGYIIDDESGKIVGKVDNNLNTINGSFEQGTNQINQTMVNGATNSINDFNSTFDNRTDDAKTTANNFGNEVGGSIIDGYREATGWGSPWDTILDSIQDMLGSFEIGLGGISSSVNTMFYDFGGDAVESMYSGMASKDGLNILSNLSGFGKSGNLKLINDNPEGIQNNRTIGMNPGSQAAAKEVREALATQAKEAGEEDANAYSDALTDGLISNIGSSSSSSTTAAKEEIKEQSEIIAEAYEEAIDEIELRAKQADLEHNLWAAVNKDAEEAELVAKSIAYTAKKISYQQERLAAALDQYQDMTDAYGEESIESRKAYMTVLETQTDLAELQNELAELQNTYISNEEELLDRMEKVRNQRSLEYQLWEAMNPDASEAEKQLKEKEELNAQLEDATEDLILAQDNYTKAVERYGEGSNEAMDAWATYLKAAIDQANLQKELSDSATASAEDMQQAWRDYGTYMAQHNEEIEDLQKMGFSFEEIARSIRQQFGIPEAIQQAQEELEETAETSAEQIYEKYGMTMQAGFVELEPQFTQQGVTFTTDLADGMKSEEPMALLKDSTNEVILTAIQTANSDDNLRQWSDSGEEIINGLIKGLTNKEGELYAAVTRIINEALAAARRAAGVQSPSRETMWIAEMMDTGFTVGIVKYSPMVISAIAKLMNSAIDKFTDTHTMNTLEFAGRLVAEGIADGFDSYSYTVMDASQGILDRLEKQVEDELPVLDSKILNMLDAWGYSIEDMDYEFVMSLNADKAYDELTDFEKAVLNFETLASKADRFNHMDYEEFLAYYKTSNGIGHNRELSPRHEERARAEYEAYLDSKKAEYMEALYAYENAYRLINQQIQEALKTGQSFKDILENMRYEKITNYTQNIYSQKPLSSLDVYRNTNNALARIT